MTNDSQAREPSLRLPHNRLHSRLTVGSITYVEVCDKFGGLILNISEGGIAVQMAEKLSGSVFARMRFQLRKSDEWIEAAGKVAWERASTKEAGIKFINLSEQARNQIKKWILAEASVQELPKLHGRFDVVRESNRATNEPVQQNEKKVAPSQADAESDEALKVARLRAAMSGGTPNPHGIPNRTREVPNPALSSAANFNNAPQPGPRNRRGASYSAPNSRIDKAALNDQLRARLNFEEPPARSLPRLLIGAVIAIGLAALILLGPVNLKTALTRLIAPQETASTATPSASRPAETSPKAASDLPVQQPAHANPASNLPTDQPAHANPGSNLPTDQPATANPGSNLPTGQPATANPGSNLPTGQPATANPGSNLPTGQPAAPPNPASGDKPENSSQPETDTPVSYAESTADAPASHGSAVRRGSQASSSKISAHDLAEILAGQQRELARQRASVAPSARTSPRAAGVAVTATMAGTVEASSRFHAIRVPDELKSQAQAGENLEVGQLISSRVPAYPPDAARQGIQGVVRLRAVVDRSGAVRVVSVLSGPAALAQPSIEAARQWRFAQTLLAGEPMESEEDITFVFTLPDESASTR
ncbi:MAG: TonB family protein [Candidatus Acidiferrales bacterium]